MQIAETLEYGGKTYRTVEIGTQIWMAENLNYAGQNGDIGRYYEDNPANGEKYGRLYTWDEAMKVCIPGWHLPSNEEWKTLVDFAGRKIAGRKLKAKSGWFNGWFKDGNGTDEFGFSALPGGGSSGDGFDGVDLVGVWWSAGKCNGSKDLYSWYMNYYSEYTSEYCANKSSLYSVRCVKN